MELSKNNNEYVGFLSEFPRRRSKNFGNDTIYDVCTYLKCQESRFKYLSKA